METPTAETGDYTAGNFTEDSYSFTDIPVKEEWGLDLSVFSDIIPFSDIDVLTSKGSEDPTFLPTIVLYAIVFFIGIIGNAIVIVVLLMDKKSHNVTNSFLVSLAVADLLFLLLIVPYDVAVKLLDLPGGRAFCKLSNFVEMTTVSASIWNLTSVSVERYIVIVHPMKTRTLCTFGTTKKIIVAVWAIAIGLSLPCLYIYDTSLILFYNTENYGINEKCSKQNYNKGVELLVFVWYHLISMIILPTVIMGFCYIMVIRVLWVSTRQLAKMTNYRRSSEVASLARQGTPAKGQSTEMVEARKQVIRMLITIIVIFLICWCPKLIMSVLKGYACTCLHNNIIFTISMVINALPYFQSALNPVIYCFMSRNFRQSIKHAFHVCFPQLHETRHSDSMGLGSLKHPSSQTNHVHGPQTIDTDCD